MTATTESHHGGMTATTESHHGGMTATTETSLRSTGTTFKIQAGNHFYIGSTTDLVKCRGRHRGLLKRGVHPCAKLQRAYDKAGSCDVFLLRPLPLGELAAHEQEVLDFYAGNSLLCNRNAIALGPEYRVVGERGPVVVGAITRSRMAEAKRGARNPKSRGVLVTSPVGATTCFPSVSDAARFFHVSQQLFDSWMKGVVAWPVVGGRTKTCNEWIAGYSAVYVGEYEV